MGIEVPDEADESDPVGRISLSYPEFLQAVGRMREVDFPIERDPAEAWPDFAFTQLLFENGLQQADGIETELGNRIGTLRQSA